MGEQSAHDGATARQGEVLVRYWAAARSAAGTSQESVPVTGDTTLAHLLSEVLARHEGDARLRDVIGVCSVLVGDRPVGAADPGDVVLRPGDTVELLPPFAGG